jgi:hypothetical protein
MGRIGRNINPRIIGFRSFRRKKVMRRMKLILIKIPNNKIMFNAKINRLKSNKMWITKLDLKLKINCSNQFIKKYSLTKSNKMIIVDHFQLLTNPKTLKIRL